MVGFFYNSSKGLNNAKKLTNNINLKYKTEGLERQAYCNRDRKTNNNKKTCKNKFPEKFKKTHKNLFTERDDKLNRGFIFYKDKVFKKIEKLSYSGMFDDRVTKKDIIKLVKNIEKLKDVNNYKIKIHAIKQRGFDMNDIFKSFKPETSKYAYDILYKKDVNSFKQNTIKLILKELKTILDTLICKA
jgi:hypothetical protein